MKRSEERSIVWDDTRGGRNDTDAPMTLRADQCVEFLNMDWKDTAFGRKRGGSTTVAITGGTAFSLGMQAILRHVPGGSEAAAEFWGVDGAGVIKRLTGGTTWADVPLNSIGGSEFPNANSADIVGVTLNGKLFLAYNSAADVLHVYDPNLGTPAIKRVGFSTPAAPTVANVGGGTYAAVLRYYRVRWIQASGDTTWKVSEPGASVAFTPVGTAAVARVTQPAVSNEGETHWRIEASTDNATFYKLSDVVIGTTIYDDSAATTTYPNNALSALTGFHTRPTSWKYLLSDGNRLLGLGSWETGGKNARMWFTPVLGSADQGDDERVPNTTSQKNWVDLNENDGGFGTGLGGPLNGVPYAFKYRQVWRLRPTSDVGAPYLPRKIRDDIGSIRHQTIALGEDQHGDAALYFLSHRGPYRITIDGAVQYLGRDNKVTWRSMNLAASTVVAHSTYYPDLHQWWVWIATGASNDPDVKMIFDVEKGFPDERGQIRGGWAKHDGPSAGARCSCLMSHTLGATMSRDLKPYIGRASGTAIWELDTTALDDAGTDFQAYAKSRPVITAGDLGRKVGMQEPYLLAKALTGVTLTLTSDRDFDAEIRTHTQTLTAAGPETRVFKKFDGGEVGEADVIQVQIGDGAAQEGAWSIDAVIIPTTPQEQK